MAISLKSKKTFLISLAAVSSVMFGCLFLNFYQEQQANAAFLKEESLKLVKVNSKQLEKRAKFLNIKLGTSISDYKGFMPFTFESSICDYASAMIDESANETAWGYFPNDRKYSSIGHFQIGSHYSDLYRLKLINNKEKGADPKIMVFTLKGKIYKIHADIEEQIAMMQEQGEGFNNFLHIVYGASVNDNGHNDVKYLSTDNITWESKNVLLNTISETKLNYVDNKLSPFMTHITHVEYMFKPLQEELNHIQADNKEKMSNDAMKKL